MTKYRCGHNIKLGFILSRIFKNFTIYWYAYGGDECLNCCFKSHEVLFWKYGEVTMPRSGDKLARRHIFRGNVQLLLWKEGEQGHQKDYWHDYHSDWWSYFKSFK